MDEMPTHRGQLEYLQEGFILHWDEEILSVEVIDYHATVLRLAWKDVLALAAIAAGAPRPTAPRSRSKRNPPPEV